MKRLLGSFLQKYFFHNDHRPSHNKALDGLRGLAVMLVMLAHLSNNKIFLHEYLNFSGIGKSGVYLFFLLSSYLLDRQITLAIKSGNSTIFYWLNYFLRRFLRIYPLYIFLLIAYFIIHQLGYEYCICMRNFKVIFSHLFLLQGNGLFWSIPVEFKYYFLSPLIIFCYAYIFKWNKLLIGFVTALIICSITYYTYTHGYFTKTEVYTWPYLPVFLIGSLLAVYQILHSNIDEVAQKYGILLDILGILSLILIFVLCSVYYFRLIIPKEYNFMLNLIRRMIVLQGLLFGVLLIASQYGRGIVRSIFSFKPLRYIGIISFSLYLIHFPVIKYVRELSFETYDSSWKFVYFFVLTILISTLTYLVVELPFSKISVFDKDKLFNNN